MPGSDFSALDAAVAGLTTQVAATEGTESSATVLINGFGAATTKAVADALAADDAADEGSIAAASAAIAAVTARFAASASPLVDAISTNNPTPPTP